MSTSIFARSPIPANLPTSGGHSMRLKKYTIPDHKVGRICESCHASDFSTTVYTSSFSSEILCPRCLRRIGIYTHELDADFVGYVTLKEFFLARGLTRPAMEVLEGATWDVIHAALHVPPHDEERTRLLLQEAFFPPGDQPPTPQRIENVCGGCQIGWGHTTEHGIDSCQEHPCFIRDGTEGKS